jgi:hypothetical protein
MTQLNSMLIVRIIDNPLDLATFSEYHPVALLPFLVAQFQEWPLTAKLYRDTVAISNDVTPTNQEQFDALTDDGVYYVVVWPDGPLAIVAIGVLAFVALTAITLAFFMPKVPEARNTTQSANNTLGNRTNEPRPNARIDDIFGTVRSIPALLSVPYRVFDNHRELEISFLGIGRGSYVVEDIRDGDSLASSIDGVSIAVYGPGASPNNGVPPQVQVGAPIGDPLFDVRRLNEVNGQVLKAANDTAVRAAEEISFADGGIIKASGGAIDFTNFFEVGDEVEVVGAVDDGSNPTPVQHIRTARAVGPNRLEFTAYNPIADFQVGQHITITGASWGFSNGEPAGDLPIRLDGRNVSERFLIP